MKDPTIPKATIAQLLLSTLVVRSRDYGHGRSPYVDGLRHGMAEALALHLGYDVYPHWRSDCATDAILAFATQEADADRLAAFPADRAAQVRRCATYVRRSVAHLTQLRAAEVTA